MTTADPVEIARKHFETFFPKVCLCCGLQFDSLRAFVTNARVLGVAVSFDETLAHWEYSDSVEALVYASCTCGNSLALGTVPMNPADRIGLFGWVRTEMDARGVTPSTALGELMESVVRIITAAGVRPG